MMTSSADEFEHNIAIFLPSSWKHFLRWRGTFLWWNLIFIFGLKLGILFLILLTLHAIVKKQSKEKKKIYSIEWKRVWEAGDVEDEHVGVGVDHVYVSVAFPRWSRDWTRLFRGKFVADEDEEEDGLGDVGEVQKRPLEVQDTLEQTRLLKFTETLFTF